MFEGEKKAKVGRTRTEIKYVNYVLHKIVKLIWGSVGRWNAEKSSVAYSDSDPKHPETRA